MKKTRYVKKDDVKGLFTYLLLAIIFALVSFGGVMSVKSLKENTNIINEKYCTNHGYYSYWNGQMQDDFNCPSELHFTKAINSSSQWLSVIIAILSAIATLFCVWCSWMTFYCDILGVGE